VAGEAGVIGAAGAAGVSAGYNPSDLGQRPLTAI
jgi:hypothetical protein